MARYRKRYPKADEFIAELHPNGLRAPTLNLHGAVYSEVCGGTLVVHFAADFDREYERVEEEAKRRGAFCGWCSLYVDPNGVDTHRYLRTFFHHHCWPEFEARERENFTKKPSPPTLADLTPGDVFRWAEEDLFGPKQYLGGGHCYSSYTGRVSGCEGVPKVLVLRHHPLTPKQLLWVNATPEERKALEESIGDKGLPILRGEKRGNGHDDCPLCKMFHLDLVQGSSATLCSGKGLVCLLWRGEQGGCTGMGYGHGLETPQGPDSYRRARAFWVNIAKWLPNIHPLRLEVEATPVEWGGKK
ncbi:unnamed protein product [marine sediment metagenome]|uniref:Uncharacterized protein n=1 Tax=marine sediment metagenome TaxID=412755 RepID=X0T0E2_9ZZZZ